MMQQWLITYLIHSTLLVALSSLTLLVPRWRQPSMQDLVWKTALVAALLTSTVQILLPEGPWFRVGQIEVAATPAVAMQPASDVTRAAGLAAPGPVAEPAVVPPQPRREAGWQLPRWDWAWLAGWGWLLGAGMLLLGLGRRLAAQQRLLSCHEPVENELQRQLLGDAWPRVTLRSCAAIDSPLATLGRHIYLPPRFFELPTDQQVAVVSHELGHVTRGDPGWRLATQLISALLFVQPLNRLAARRINHLAELLSDRYAVAERGSSRRALAHSLACFALPPRTAGPIAATGMARQGKGLVQRIQKLLEDAHMNQASRTRPVLPVIIICAAVGAVALPALDGGTQAAERRGTSINIHSDGAYSEISLSHTDSRRRVSLDAEGRIEFADDESDITALSDDGFFDLKVTEDGIERRLKITADNDVLTRRYWVDGSEEPFDPAGRRWLGEYLPMVFRLTGIDAEERVARLLRRGGAETVIAEIAAIDSDLVARIYTGHLVEQARLDEAQLDVLLAELARGIGSDLELRLALGAVMEHGELTADHWQRVLTASEAIGSDLEARLVLSAAAAAMPTDAELVRAYAAATRHIGSDLEARLAISALGPHLGAADAAAVSTLFEAAAGIDSDLELRLTLEALSGLADSRTAQEAYVAAARTIGSDLEARLALQHLVERGVSDALAASIAEAAATTIGSDLELRLVLDELLDRHMDSNEVRQAVIAAAERIGSDHERNRLLSRLAR